MTLFDYAALTARASAAAPGYAAAAPFPHAVLDEIADPAALSLALERFPAPDDLAWWKYDNPLERKLATNRLELLPEAFRSIFLELNSGAFITALERLTGIDGLIPDPHLNGGGLHRIERGGKLDVHADYNYHPRTRLDRRLNVLIYLNRDWREEYGGHLELWDRGMTLAVQRILPVFNRMVVFSTTDTSFHGHPVPLTCPDGRARKSLAMYFYTNGRPESERSAPHSTLYQRRPEDPSDPEIEELRRRRAKGRLADLTTKRDG